MKLYEITEQFAELARLSESADEDMAVAIRDTLSAVEAEFEDKAKAVAAVALNHSADVEQIDAAIQRLQERKRVINNRHESLKDYLRENMEAAGIKKISHPLFTITLAKGRDSVVIDDKDKLPDDMVRVKTVIEPDKTAIAAAIKAGGDVPGAHVEQGKSSIRFK